MIPCSALFGSKSHFARRLLMTFSTSAKQERQLISGGLTNEFNSAITKMMLTKHGYTDKTETDITTKGKQINTWVINPVTTSKD
jgi:hypothetical protein